MQWFRFYSEALNDPKVQTLPDNLFKFWVNCLCLASQNDGFLPDDQSVSFSQRCSLDSVSSALHTLKKLGLIDEKHGRKFPHNWSKRQFKSDTSTERVKRFRKRSDPVTVTPPEQIQSRTDTESDTEHNITPLSPKRGKGFTKPDIVNESIWEDFLKIRKAKKAPITDTAIKGIIRESDKAGISLNAALEICIERNWQGFKAEWLEKKPSHNKKILTQALEMKNEQCPF